MTMTGSATELRFWGNNMLPEAGSILFHCISLMTISEQLWY